MPSRGRTRLDLSEVHRLVDPIASKALRVEDDLTDDELRALEHGVAPRRVVHCRRFQGRTLEERILEARQLLED